MKCPTNTRPHGADEWIAICCTDDDQSRRLAAVIGRVDLADLDVERRRRMADEIDGHIVAFIAERDPRQLQVDLQAAGIAAHHVQRSADRLADDRLARRGHFRRVSHPVHGEVTIEGPHVLFSLDPPRPRFGGPTMGQHTSWALETLLAYSEVRIVDLVVNDALGSPGNAVAIR